MVIYWRYLHYIVGRPTSCSKVASYHITRLHSYIGKSRCIFILSPLFSFSVIWALSHFSMKKLQKKNPQMPLGTGSLKKCK